jgi:hypothetical protein
VGILYCLHVSEVSSATRRSGGALCVSTLERLAHGNQSGPKYLLIRLRIEPGR